MRRRQGGHHARTRVGICAANSVLKLLTHFAHDNRASLGAVIVPLALQLPVGRHFEFKSDASHDIAPRQNVPFYSSPKVDRTGSLDEIGCAPGINSASTSSG